MPDVIEIVPGLTFLEDDLIFRFVRSPGPGGQNVNKLATAAVLKFECARLSGASAQVMERLKQLAGRRLGGDGVITIKAARTRSQERNRQDAIERLVTLIRRASQVPAPRRAKKPSRAARARRMDTKKQRGSLKRLRGRVSGSDGE